MGPRELLEAPALVVGAVGAVHLPADMVDVRAGQAMLVARVSQPLAVMVGFMEAELGMGETIIRLFTAVIMVVGKAAMVQPHGALSA